MILAKKSQYINVLNYLFVLKNGVVNIHKVRVNFNLYAYN